MTNFTNEQLEAWAGLSAKAIIASLAGIETPQMKGDNLAVILCSCFENPDQEQGEDGWTPDAIKGFDDVMAAIREHLAPLTASPDLAGEVLKLRAEVAEKDTVIGGMAYEIECLRIALFKYGDRVGMASAPAFLQGPIDEAMGKTLLPYKRTLPPSCERPTP